MPIYYKKVDGGDPPASPSRLSLSDRSRGGGSRFSLGVKNKLIFRRSSALELSNVDSNFPLISCPRIDQTLGPNEEIVETSCGSVLIAHQGADLKSGKPIIVTFHDLGLNYSTNFEDFFEYTDNKILLQSFSVLHINAPGQENFASSLPDSYAYPSMDQLTILLEEVIDHFEVKTFIAFGCGVGSNVFLRFSLRCPDRLEGLFLINPSTGRAAWTEWFFQRKNIRAITNNNRSSLLPISVQEFLLWYHFGTTSEKRDELSRESMDILKSAWKGIQLNPTNLSFLIQSYIDRSDLKICREVRDFQPKSQTAILTGDYSPQLVIEESVDTNARLDPSRTTWIKLSDCGFVLGEKPHAVAQAFRLFLQGIGYTLKAYERRKALMAGTSMPCLSGGSSSSGSIQPIGSAIDI